jgi:hypothetical protein
MLTIRQPHEQDRTWLRISCEEELRTGSLICKKLIRRKEKTMTRNVKPGGQSE